MDDRDTLCYYDRPDQLPDLRAGTEALKDRVLTRAEALEDEQRALLTAILDQGSSYQQVARLSGEHATTVSRRFRRLLRKLSHRTGNTTGAKAGQLAPLDKTILSCYYLFGMNQSQIAARLGISRYRVRKALEQFATQQRGSAPVLRSFSEAGSSPIASDTKVSNGSTSTAKHPSSLPELRRTESLTVPPVKANAARSITVAAQNRRPSCTR